MFLEHWAYNRDKPQKFRKAVIQFGRRRTSLGRNGRQTCERYCCWRLPDGKSQEEATKAGTIAWDAGGKHLPENIGDKPFELILVELKSKPAAKK